MPPIISFVTQKGGAGKSSLAYAIAFELQKRHGPTLIIDLDESQWSLAKNAAAAVADGKTPPETVRLDVDRYPLERLRERVRDYSAVLIDTPGRSDKAQRWAMAVCDLALVPVVFDGMNTLAIEDTVERLLELKRLRPDVRAAIVLNQQLGAMAESKKARRVLSATGLPVMRTELFTRTAWRKAHLQHQPLGMHDPWGRAARELRRLTDEVERITHMKKGMVNA